MFHDRSSYLMEALRDHVDTFRNMAEQLKHSIETSINIIGNDFWENNAEKIEAITKVLERYTSNLNYRIKALCDNVIDAYKETRLQRREVADAFVLLRGLLQVYSNLLIYGTTAPIIDVTSFSPPQSPVLAIRSHLRKAISYYNGPDISLANIDTIKTKHISWEIENLKPETVSIQDLLSGKEGPLAIKNAIVDTYLNDTRGLYNSLFQTLIRDYGEDVAPYPSALVGTASRLLESKNMKQEIQVTNPETSDKLLYNQRRYFREKLTFHEHVLSSYHEVHQSLENSLQVHNPSLLRNLHTRTALTNEHMQLRQALSFLYQSEYNNMSLMVSELESCINTATNELPRALLIDSPSFSTVSMLDTKLQIQVRVLALIKKQISIHTRFDITELEHLTEDIGKKLRHLDEHLKQGIPKAVRYLEDQLMVEIGANTSTSNKDFPALHILNVLQKYRQDPDILLQEYMESSFSIKAMEYYLQSLMAVAQPGDEDHQYVIALLRTFDTYFDNPIKEMANTDYSCESNNIDRHSISDPEKRLLNQYNMLHNLSLSTAVSIASGSFLSSMQIFDKSISIPGLKDITPDLFSLTSHRRLPTSVLLQEADTITTALRPLIEPHGVLSHALHNTSELIQSIKEDTRVLATSIFTDNRNARLADLSRAYEVRNRMRFEDIMGKIRRCFDVHDKAVIMLKHSITDLLGQKSQVLPKIIGNLALPQSGTSNQKVFESLKNMQLNMQYELSSIEKFIKSRKRYTEYLEELCQEGKAFSNLKDEITKIVESHSAMCNKSLELVRRNSDKHIEQIKDLWNEGILKYDQLTQDLYTETTEDKLNFVDLKTFIEPCLLYSQLPPPQSLVFSICAPFIKNENTDSNGNDLETTEKQVVETKARVPRESPIVVKVPILSPSGKVSVTNILKVAKALDTATKGSLFYGFEDIANRKMESVYVKLHFSLRYIEFSFEEGTFSLYLSNITDVQASSSTLSHDDNAYLCLALITPQLKYDIYTRDRITLQEWVCSLKNVLAYGKNIKSLRRLWIASSKRNITA